MHHHTVAVVGPSALLRHHTALLLASGSDSRPLAPESPSGDPSEALHAALDTIDAQAAPIPTRYVIELPDDADPLEAIGTLASASSGTQLDHILCCVDALTLEHDLRSLEPHRDGSDPLTPNTLLLARQLEYASVIALANAEQLTPEALARTAALASMLSPAADIIAHTPELPALRPSAHYRIEQDQAGWLQLLNGQCTPELAHPSVTGLRYENLRPFHPWRLHAALSDIFERGLFGAVVRSGGFVQLASRPGIELMWEQAGAELNFTELDGSVTPEPLSLGQELAFIGLDIDAAALSERLDLAALTDVELLGGPELWAGFSDPFAE